MDDGFDLIGAALSASGIDLEAGLIVSKRLFSTNKSHLFYFGTETFRMTIRLLERLLSLSRLHLHPSHIRILKLKHLNLMSSLILTTLWALQNPTVLLP